MRTGFLRGEPLKAGLISSRSPAAWGHGRPHPLWGLVTPLDGRSELLFEIPLGVVVLGENEDPEVRPCGSGLAESRSTSSAGSTRGGSGGGRQAGRGGFGNRASCHRGAVFTGEELLGGGVFDGAERGGGSRIELCLLFRLQVFFGKVARSSSRAYRPGQQIDWTEAQGCFGSSQGSSHCLDGPAMDLERAGEGLHGRQQPLLQPRIEAPLRPACVSFPSGASFAEIPVLIQQVGQVSSGASAGRPSMSSCTTLRLGNPPWTSRISSFSLRTVTSSRSFALTGTPRQNRWGSSISRRAEKLLEWPLCGVAERKRRCSNLGPAHGWRG